MCLRLALSGCDPIKAHCNISAVYVHYSDTSNYKNKNRERTLVTLCAKLKHQQTQKFMQVK